MVPRNSIELQVGYINRLHFIFEAHVFITWLLSRFEKVGFILFSGDFFSSVHLLWNFFFCGCCFCCCCWCWWWFLFYLCGVWFFIHPPSLLSTLFVVGHHQLVSWNVCFRHTKTSTHGEHKHAHIQSHSQSHSHISTRSHLHHCECARAVLIEAKIRF